jgi:hypothetical protein
MLKSTLLPVLCLLAFQASAQGPQNTSWIKPLYGQTAASAASAEATDLDTDAQGNVYLTGMYRHTLNLGSGIVLSTGNDTAAFFLAKFNADGTPQWGLTGRQTRSDDPDDLGFGPQISVDAGGNVYWASNYEADALQFGNTTVTRVCTNDCNEAFLLKISTDGAVVFSKNLRASVGNDFYLAGIACADDGTHAVSGLFEGTEVWLQGGANVGGLTVDGFFLGKYNASGGAEWVAFQSQGSAVPNARTIAMSPDGKRIAVGGYYNGPLLDFGNGTSTTSASNNKQFVVWYNDLGQPQHALTLGSSSYVDVYDARLDNQYRWWAVYDYYGNLDVNGAAFGTPGTSGGNTVLARLSPTGSTAVETLTFSGSTLPMSTVAVTPVGDWFTAGAFTNSITVPGMGSQTGMGCTDVLFTGGSNSSAVDWVQRLGGSGCEAIRNVYFGSLLEADGNGNLYAAGSFENGGTFGPATLPGNGLWVGKLSGAPVAAEEAEKEAPAFRLAPNPAQGFTTLQLPETEQGLVRVYDPAGNRLMEQNHPGGSLTLSTGNWNPGVYQVTFTAKTSGRTATQTLVVVR